MLATGIMNPDVEEKAKATESSDYPEADFNLDLINSKGEKVSMEQFKGKVIFINIWATWCPPLALPKCRESISSIMTLKMKMSSF